MATLPLASPAPPARMRRACLATLIGALSLPLAAHAADITWTNTAGGNWSVAANWNSGAGPVPGAGDVAHITTAGTYTVTLDADVTVGGLDLGAASGTQTLSGASRTLTLNGASTVNANGILAIRSSTVAGPGTLAISGRVNALGANTLSGTVTTAAGSVLRVEGNSTVGTSTLTVASGFTNLGTIEFGSTGGGFAANLAVTNGTLVNAVGGTIDVQAGAGGTRTLDVQLDNQGTMQIATPLTMSHGSSVHQNSGTITINGTGTWSLSQSGTTPSFTNTGTVTIGSGRTWTVAGGTLAMNGGSIGGAGTLALSSATATLNIPFTNAVTTLTLASSIVNGPSTLTNSTGRTLSQRSSTINAPFVNQGTLLVTGGSTLNGTVTTAAGSVLRVEGNSTVGTSTLTVASGFTNLGTIELGSIGGGFAANLALTTGTLVNAVGGTIDVQAGSAGTRTLDVQLDNQGTMQIATPLTMGRASSVHQNSGTITINGTGTWSLSQSGTTPSFTNTGTVTIDSGRTWTVSGGTVLMNAGSIGGAGTLALSSATATLNVAFSNAVTTFTLSSSTVNGPATLTNSTGRTLSLRSSTINAPFVNQGTLLVTGGSTLNGTVTTAAGSVLRVEGNSTVGTSTLTVASGFTNLGTIELGSIGGGFAANFVVTSGTLVNAGGGTIDVQTGSGGLRALDVQLDNQGAIQVATPLTMGRASSAHQNSGTLMLSGTATLTLTQSGTTPSFTNTGTVTIGSGRTWTVSGGTLLMNAGSIGGAGTLALSSATATLNIGFSNAVTTLTLIASTVNGPASLTNATGRTLSVRSSTINAPLVNQGTLLVTASSVVNGTLTTAVGSVIRVEGNSTSGTATLNVASGFTSLGTIELGSIGGGFAANLTVASGTLVNAVGGTIDVQAGTAGTRNLDGQLDNQGTMLIGAPFTLSRASADHLSSGTITVNGATASMTVSQSGTTPSFTNSGVVTVHSGRTLTSNTGTFVNAAPGLLQGVGTYNFGTTFTNAGTIGPGLSPGLLSITGNAPFTGGNLRSEIGGLTAGTQYDQLAVSGTATLGDTLEVIFTSNYCAHPGDSFRVLNAGTRVGTFAAIVVSGVGNVVLNPVYDATGLTLVTVSNDFTITASAGPNGSVSPAGPVLVACGDNQAFTITPADCHHIVDVLVDGVSQGAIPSYTFLDVKAHHTISATFAINTYLLSASAGPNGTIDPDGDLVVNCGTDRTYTITPDACHHIQDVLVDGVSVGAASSHTFTNITAPHTISASFAINQYTITASSGPNGTVTPPGPSVVNCGSDATYTITPASCYHVADVLVDGVSVGPVTSHTFTSVNAAHTISASFALSQYTITASAGPNGSITPSGPVIVDCGLNQGFTITPVAGFGVADVLVDGVSAGAVTNYTFNTVTAAHTIAASFVDIAAPAVLVVAPNGGEVWTVSNHRTIRWTASDNVGVDSVFVEYSLLGASGPWTTIDHVAGTLDSLVWTVPNECADSARVRITARDVAGNTGSDLSNAGFRMRCGTLDAPIWNGALSLSVPSPVRSGPVRLLLSVPGSGEATVEILNVAGRRVWSARVAAGRQQELTWDGRGQGIEAVSPGVYFVRLRAASGERSVRFALLR